MTRVDLPADERLLELMTAWATVGLSDAERQELDRLIARYPDIDRDELALAAAEADVVLMQTDAARVEPMPESVRRRIIEESARYMPERPSSKRTEDPPLTFTPDRRMPKAGSEWLSARMAGWYAAAAMALLALFFAFSGPNGAPVSPDLVQQRDTFLQSVPDAVRISWNTPEEAGYEQVRGDVVWSDSRQTGFLRFTNLPANRPTVAQYQLWIVDPQRDEQPVDGGVFDVPAGVREVVVPIDAKLAVKTPAAFAVTLEKPGGVVVSDGPLLVVAAARS